MASPRQKFLEAALSKTSRLGKSDVKRFIKACDTRFGDSITEYRMNLVVRTIDGQLYAFSGMTGDFYQLEEAAE